MAEQQNSGGAGGAGNAGSFGFFRKYQKIILYTAGIFALLSFSITGALLGFFQPSASESYAGARMTLPDGRTINVTYEDWVVGGWMRRAAMDPAVVLPGIPEAEDGDNLRARYAALRRLAIEYGIEVSDIEVDRAIALAGEVLAQNNWESITQWAVTAGNYPSLTGYKNVVREAMRIGTFVRLQALAADTTDASLADELLEESELVELEVAVLDKKAMEDELRDAGVDDETLQQWLEGLDDSERVLYQDTNHVALRAGGFAFAGFDKSAFAEELGDREWTDEQLRQEYTFRRETYFRRPVEKPTEKEGEGEKGNGNGEGKGGEGRDEDVDLRDATLPGELGDPTAGQQPGAGNPPPSGQSPGGQSPGGQSPTEGQQPPVPPPDPYLPFEEVKDRLLTMLQAEAVLDALRNGPVQVAFAAHMADFVEARNAALRAVVKARKVLEEAEAALAADPDSTEKKDAVDAAKAALEAKEAAEKAAEEALTARRVAFDFVASLREHVAGRAELLSHVVPEPVGNDGLRDMGPLGTWQNTFAATAMSAAGDISTLVQRTDVACFHFQVTEIVERPLKPFEEIAEQARNDYFRKRADELAEERAEAFEEKLLELARAEVGDEIAELEKRLDEEIEQEMKEWTEAREAEVRRAEETLAKVREGTLAYRRWKAKIEDLRQQLARADEHRAELDKEFEDKLAEETKKISRKVYAKILPTAAEAVGLVVKKVGPLPQNIASIPRFRDRFEDDVVFLFSDPQVDIANLKVGDATDLLTDTANRAMYLAVCTDRSEATVENLMRRQIVGRREQFEASRMLGLVEQSFTMEALEKRFAYKSPEVDDGKPKILPAGTVGTK